MTKRSNLYIISCCVHSLCLAKNYICQGYLTKELVLLLSCLRFFFNTLIKIWGRKQGTSKYARVTLFYLETLSLCTVHQIRIYNIQTNNLQSKQRQKSKTNLICIILSICAINMSWQYYGIKMQAHTLYTSRRIIENWVLRKKVSTFICMQRKSIKLCPWTA